MFHACQVDSRVSLRLDENTRLRVERIAQRRKVAASHIIREAIERWVEREEEDLSPYDSIKDLIGAARGGDIALSHNTGKRFTEVLKARQRRNP